MNQVKRMTALISLIIMIILMVLEVGFMLFIKPQGYTYVHGMMALIISVLAIIFSVYPFMILMHNAKRRWTLAIIILLVNLLHIFMGSDFTTNSIVSYGKDISRPIAIKTHGQSVYIMEDTRFFFAKMGNASAIPMKDEHRITWLNKDTGVFTYRGIDDKYHIYVSSYTNKDKISYYNIAPSIQGEWKSNNEILTIQSDGIQIGNILYENNQISQVGTGAIILNNALGDAQYVIALGENFEFNKSNSPKKGSDLIFWKVSFDIAPQTFVKNDKEVILNTGKSNLELEKDSIHAMKETLKENPTLENYEAPYGFVNVKDTSNDLMWIARQIIYTNDIRPDVGTGCSNDVIVKSAKVLAQKQNEFYIMISTTETASCGNESETMDLDWKYRVIKYNEGYFAFRITTEENGYYKLKKLKTPVLLESDGSENYHYFIQK